MKLIVGLLIWVMANAITADIGARFKPYSDGCFAMLDVDTGKWTRYNEKRCAERFSPCSTFKIPNSLILLDSEVVKNVDGDVLKWNGVRKNDREGWNQDQTLRHAFKYSVVWYYQDLASKVGEKKMKDYVDKLHYGNMDTTSGVNKFWLGQENSLRISADEQCEFMRDFMLGKLPFSADEVAKVKDVMTISSDAKHSFGGKTGSDADPKTHKRNLNWFVGYATSGGHRYVFATNISGKDLTGNSPAKFLTMNVLKDLGVL